MRGIAPEPPEPPEPPGPDAPTDRMLGVVYDELRALAAFHLRQERPEHTLSPTAVVHEVYLRLSSQDGGAWASREHFLAVASRMVRRILVDHARARLAQKRDGGIRVPLEGLEPAAPGEADVLTLDSTLSELAALDERQARVVELRFFGGLSMEEAARVLGVSLATVRNDWRVARAWLAARIGPNR